MQMKRQDESIIRILAFTDLHDSHPALKKVISQAKRSDIVVCAGDISVFSRGINRLLSKLADLNKEVLIIHGNHELPSEIQILCKKYANLHFIHKKTYRLGKYLFLGYGGGGFGHIDKKFESFIISLKKKAKIKRGDKVVLVTHAPPFNTVLDQVMGAHVGNQSILKYVKIIKPKLLICGHIHECENKMQVLGKTLMINPGPKGRILEL
jgi:Icc-related predicted phosphoesterase